MAGKDILIIGLIAVIVSLLAVMAMPKRVFIPVQPTPAVTVPTKPVSDIPATSDAGKPCTDRSQCESFCWAGEGAGASRKTSGTCYPWKYFTSCINSVNNGRTTAICAGGVNMIELD